MKVMHIMGARPNFMKVAPIMAAMRHSEGFQQCLVHTGQRYDAHLSQSFFGAMLQQPPLGYLDFLCLMARAKFVLTDSGGVQEETTILGGPCLTLWENTERPVTLLEKTNTLVCTRV
jgi:UDP-N-acetylglucosamine 2-epimerase